MIRSSVGKQLGLRLTPTIEFVLDSLPKPPHDGGSSCSCARSAMRRSASVPRALRLWVMKTLTGTPPARTPRPSSAQGRERNRQRAIARLARPKPWGDLPRGTYPCEGLLFIDKDQGVTSHDIVGALRRLGATRQVGHAGTLDPMATGLLIVATGRLSSSSNISWVRIRRMRRASVLGLARIPMTPKSEAPCRSARTRRRRRDRRRADQLYRRYHAGACYRLGDQSRWQAGT